MNYLALWEKEHPIKTKEDGVYFLLYFAGYNYLTYKNPIYRAAAGLIIYYDGEMELFTEQVNYITDLIHQLHSTYTDFPYFFESVRKRTQLRMYYETAATMNREASYRSLLRQELYGEN